MSYRLHFAAHSGCSPLPDTFDDQADARAAAARMLRRRRRQGFIIATQTPGEEWEVIEPDDAAMVSDLSGLLWIEAVAFECEECGTIHDDHGAAFWCCLHSDDE